MSQLPQLEFITKHYFADGMYCRKVERPAGSVIIGKVHKREHFYMVLSGIVTVAAHGGSARIEGPAILVSKPGTKRAVYAHTDAVCCTVHRTNNTDLDAIEKELLEEDDTAMFDAHNQLKSKALEE